MRSPLLESVNQVTKQSGIDQVCELLDPSSTGTLAVEVFEKGLRRSVVRSKRGSIYVGSGSFNDIAINHPAVSRRHAHLYQVCGQSVVEPLDLNGATYVNGMSVSGPTELHPLDRIEIDDIALVIKG